MITDIVIHNSVSSRDKTTIQDLDAWHKLRWPDFRSSLGYWVGYHYVILGNGQVIQTRKDEELGAHVLNQNKGKIGICLTGNFQLEAPSEAQIASLSYLTDRLKLTYGIKDIKAHREFLKTECCGEELYKWVLEQRISWIKKLIDFLLKSRIIK